MSSQEVSIGKNAQQALVRLLGKLGFLDQTTSSAPWHESEHCPILAFSQLGKFSEQEAAKRIADQLSIPLIHVDKGNIQQMVMMLEDTHARKISIPQWTKIRAMPVGNKGQALQIAMANPLDHETKSWLEFELGIKVELAIGFEREILQVLGKQIAGSDAFQLESIIDQKRNDKSKSDTNSVVESSVFTDDPESPPVVRLVNKILSDAVDRGASDIHIEPEKQDIQVRVRVDGLMQSLFTVPAEFHQPAISRIKLLAGMDIAERRKPQDGRFRIKTSNGTKDLRVATAPTIHGENVVIRILSSDLGKLDFSSIGMQPEMLERFKRLLLGSSRVVLVTGPTGSGKTSTLYTGLASLCDGRRTIVTIEDPIEYRISGVNQIQVNQKIGLGFAEGLRSIVRQDPDVVMVGEIRDQETASIAMQVAQTGHLVLSTFHTSSAAGAVTRLQDLGIPPYVIASSLGAIVAQRLVRKLCPHCSKEAAPQTVERLKELGLTPATPKTVSGCSECSNTGYIGRTGVFSLLEVNDTIREDIRTDKGEREIERNARKHGFTTLEQSGLELVNAGITTLEELERVLGPISPEQVENAATTVAMSHRAESSTGLQRRKILLVEDDENTRAVMTMLLENEFYEVTEAANGIEGLEQVHNTIPELVICDLMMPKMNGMQFVQRLRSDQRTREIPVLMLTAASTEENEVQLISSGADDFVAKNGDTRILLARVQRLLARAL